MLQLQYLLVTEFQVSKCGSHIVKKRDVLYPKRTKFSKYSKCRCSRGCKPDGTQLGFGRYGTKSCRAGHRAIEAARRAIIVVIRLLLLYPFVLNLIWGALWLGVLPDGGLPDLNQPPEAAGMPEEVAAPAAPPQVPEPAAPPVPPAPVPGPLPLHGIEEAAYHLVLLQNIQQQIQDRVAQQSQVRGWEVEPDLRRTAATHVLHGLELADQIDTLEELRERLNQEPYLLDQLIRDFFFPL